MIPFPETVTCYFWSSTLLSHFFQMLYGLTYIKAALLMLIIEILMDLEQMMQQ